jgi:hypothetical protein
MRTKTSSVVWLVCLSVPLLALAALPGCNATVGGGGDDTEDAGSGAMEDMARPGGGPRDLSFDVDAFWAQDPPPMYCLPDGGTGMPPVPPGGTPDCPDDKNRQGCPCDKVNEVKACWPGLRANRGLGICQDGTTTCVPNGEFGYVWGPCQGYVLPTPGATTGRDACKCFSGGRWAIDNVVPCFYEDYKGNPIGAASSVLMGGKPTCLSMSDPLKAPSQPWSANTINVDCAGHWKLCYTLKAGDAKNPMASDCIVAQVCTEGDYPTANMITALPPLPAWATTSSAAIACASTFRQSGGYGEMSVDGKSMTCDVVQKVFNRVSYCPLSCQNNPMAPECMGCSTGGSGTF